MTDGRIREIPLTQGKVSIVDEEDWEYLRQFKWHYCNSGYARRWLPGRKWGFIHRVVMNTPDGMMTDHINGNKLDNRKCNLRICTNQQNQYNRQQGIKSVSGSKVYIQTRGENRGMQLSIIITKRYIWAISIPKKNLL